MISIVRTLRGRYLRSIVKYIVWDFDGTLYQSKKMGYDLRLVFLKLTRLKNRKVSSKRFDEFANRHGSWSAAASKLSDISELEILNMADMKIDKLKYIKPNPDLVRSIEKTQGSYKHLILTNSTYKEVVSGLRKIGFDVSKLTTGPFKKVFARDTTDLIKPDARVYDQILNYTKTIKGSHLFIGDSLAHDVYPAIRLGFKALPIWKVDLFFKKR